MKTRVIVDSTADMTERFRSRVTVVPLTIHFGQEVLVDGVDITKHQFYERLGKAESLPTTSQPSPAVFEETFEEVARAGESAVVITISSKLSGTYQSARIAAEGYEHIYVVDSQTATVGTGILTEYAILCAEQGMDAETLAAQLEEKRKNISVIAVLDTLEYLQKGGRISKTVAFAGGLLNIKPVVNVDGGQVNLVGKARGSKQGNNLLVQKIQETGGVDFNMPILLGYTGLDDSQLHKYIQDSRFLWEEGTEQLDSVCVGSVVGTYAGPGAVVAAFFHKNASEL